MAGWLKRENGSSVDESDKKDKTLFDEFIATFVKEIFGPNCFRPLPPVIGVGQEVDLFELHIVVKNRGGFNSVSRNGSWGLVATDCGFDSRFGSPLKLVYAKYLYTLDIWLKKVHKDKKIVEDIGAKEEFLGFSGPFMELEADLKVFLSDKVKKEFAGFNDELGFLDSKIDFKSVHEKSVKVEEYQCVNGDEQKMDEDLISKKRKRDCYLGLVKWVREVAKDPCDLAVEPLPERHKWKGYGVEMKWKQILMAREAMLLKKNVDSSPQQSVWQKKQKMHPSMYDDDQSGSERLRCSQRLIFAKGSSRKPPRERLFSESSSSGFQSDDEYINDNSTVDSPNFVGNQRRQKRVPIGPNSQADIPDFLGQDNYKSDPKWSGTKIWPLEKGEQRNSLIERDPIGKGRRESCGCQFPTSFECVRFHLREKRVKLELELCSVYYKWKFDAMGEIVALSWTKEDESKFQEIVDLNCLSSEKYFWDELFKYFPKKGREALVSYYFNVFVLRRRGCQNRSGNSNIDSDDEESEYGPTGNRFGQVPDKSPVSIFCSPKKSNSNSG
ncbi:AT-rich interactive domain-containing protein 1 [Phtheirospermum japonicum]|uniref:AT-rich interactive domain-containing protein 1 n=1 Tax=Phtheirospermum japonicum TaxID=374723 RepID=A0A830C2Y8_9LAMI|nr:AT-rich interactive domain-containing protein 1 [Phtheirospermum japonicum]